MVHPVTAIIISVTAVLFFGEIIPQSICSKYGLAVGANLSYLVRLMMLICFPLAFPIGRLLDYLLGQEHTPLFRRTQLKALVNVHSVETGLGGKLTKDEINVITGALDLTHKIAFRSMTPLDKVFMIGLDDLLSDDVLDAVLETGHSRIPVHRGSDKTDLVGLVLVKELLRYCRGGAQRVSLRRSRVPLRPIPRLFASTPMYDLLKFFQTGKSHMVLLIQPNEQQIDVVKEEFHIDSSSSSSSSESSVDGEDTGGGGGGSLVGSYVGSHVGSLIGSVRKGKSGKSGKSSKSKQASKSSGDNDGSGRQAKNDDSHDPHQSDPSNSHDARHNGKKGGKGGKSG
eukprot:CAMPEP_0175072880 /NCGR_PEP_ID=MMETSP0052_2-20121109/20189_1 /TAXON_ID=51329 ORGANISM="Polytomella parva, Strain SAG 63-3" /NCGR_SAMPLE_ID=MMETSP0052_2 /ASSEMBLY_ACC=CAM_ASM_000194 /LENGTH=340 /DNA_ID=CAMNT_0016340501 /DNA_START=380 /DNA_END=1399 /DNA_ORIENTATION=-